MKKVIEEKDKKIKELEVKITEITNNWKRALADYQNMERRVKEEKEQFAKYAKADVIEKLLPVLDNLEKTKEHLRDQNLEISIKHLWDILTNEGLTEIKTLGEKFNPLTMHAIEAVPGEEGKVIGVFQKGYCLFDKVLRPAQVRVGKGKEEKN